MARWVERTWLGIGGPAARGCRRSWITCARCSRGLRELERRGLPDAADLGDSFADLFADTGGSSPVEIMTIHKAKGLEFDMVVLPALDRHPGSNRDQLLLTHQFARTGRDGMVMAARPAVGADKDRLFEFLRRRAQDATALEAERLLYVACTRAKWQLHLTATIDSHDEDPDEGSGKADGEAADEPDSAGQWKPHVGSLLAVLWPTVGPNFAATAPPSVMDSPSARDAPAAGAALEPDYAAGRCAACPATGLRPTFSRRSARILRCLVSLREETAVFDWAGETARRVGSLVHAELQVMDLERTR